MMIGECFFSFFLPSTSHAMETLGDVSGNDDRRMCFGESKLFDFK